LISPKTEAILFSPNTPHDKPYLSYGGNYANFTLNEKDIEMVGISGGGRNLLAKSLNDTFFITILNHCCPLKIS